MWHLLSWGEPCRQRPACGRGGGSCSGDGPCRNLPPRPPFPALLQETFNFIIALTRMVATLWGVPWAEPEVWGTLWVMGGRGRWGCSGWRTRPLCWGRPRDGLDSIGEIAMPRPRRCPRNRVLEDTSSTLWKRWFVKMWTGFFDGLEYEEIKEFGGPAFPDW